MKLENIITVERYKVADKDAIQAGLDNLDIEEGSDLYAALKKAHQRSVALLVDGYRIVGLRILRGDNNYENDVPTNRVEIGGMFEAKKGWIEKLIHLLSSATEASIAGETEAGKPEKITEIPAGATGVTIYGKYVAIPNDNGDAQIDYHLDKFGCGYPYNCELSPYKFTFTLPEEDNPQEQALLDYLNEENITPGQRVEFLFGK